MGTDHCESSRQSRCHQADWGIEVSEETAVECLPGLTSVIIVSHQSMSTLPRCIDAVLGSTALVQLIVVDNASEDGAIDWLRERAHESTPLHLVANTDNRGYAAACNQGLKIARGDLVLILNPDAFLAADTIELMRQSLADAQEIGLLGCRVDDERGCPNGPQRRREPTARRSLMTLLGLDRWQHRWPRLAGIEIPPAQAQQPIELVDAVNGSAMLIRAALFRRLGGMDERFKLHAEDLDLCRRVRDEGWLVARAAKIRVVHLGGVSSRARPFWVEWQKSCSLWRYFRKHQADATWLVRSAVASGLGLRLLVRLPALTWRWLKSRI